MEDNKKCADIQDCEFSEQKFSEVENNQVKREANEIDNHDIKRFKIEQDIKIGDLKAYAQSTACGNDFSVDEKKIIWSDAVSKKKMRKLLKIQKWEEVKKERRAQEKERAKRRRMLARLNNISLGPSRSFLKKCTMANSKCKVRVVIDLSFDDLMSDSIIDTIHHEGNGLAVGAYRPSPIASLCAEAVGNHHSRSGNSCSCCVSHDMSKCVKQMLHCYSLNRRAENPMQLYFTNFNGKVAQEMEKHDGYRNWDIYFHSDSYTEIFNKSELVYLTSESDNIITELEDDKVYIIGGLVDHNAHKGVCYRVAVDQNISHGQLPIEEFLEMKTRKVLTVDHVFEILLGVSSGMSWKEAFLKVLPPRKGAKEKDINEINDILTEPDKNVKTEEEKQTDVKIPMATEPDKNIKTEGENETDVKIPHKTETVVTEADKNVKTEGENHTDVKIPLKIETHGEDQEDVRKTDTNFEIDGEKQTDLKRPCENVEMYGEDKQMGKKTDKNLETDGEKQAKAKSDSVTVE
ncbi:tRNA methyltransferase 10 homolog A isoform X1 [Schistocerca americana]|uniref:tRNA methyltransferase 10 homolog A isoform X1 n=1 Tax=Schistocerca americana TaxID=7009 RepID=UPI001F4F1B38|nr:tRNA methyltransferase 10 homolog A isoform X1 [Schistocerca americana]